MAARRDGGVAANSHRATDVFTAGMDRPEQTGENGVCGRGVDLSGMLTFVRV